MTTTTLASYSATVLQLLHDISADFYPSNVVTPAINLARRKVCEDTGCLRSLQIIQLSTGQEAYPFGTITGLYIVNGGQNYTAPTIAIGPPSSGGSQAAATATVANGQIQATKITNAGSLYLGNPTVTISDATGTGAVLVAGAISSNTIDVLQTTVVWNSYRYPTRRYPWTMFSAYMRRYTNYQQRPAAFTRYGQQTYYIAPLPDQPYTCELDTNTYPNDLVNGTDIEVIAPQYQQAVPYYACYLLQPTQQQFSESNWFYQQYEMRARQAAAADDTRFISDVFTGR